MQSKTITRTAPAVAKKTSESGLCAGTTIMTLNGEIPVEHLAVGDRVITRDCGMSVIKAIQSRDVKMQPIRIKAGSLGHTRPDRDMIVAPGARIHIRDWRAEALFGAATATVEAHRLLDGEFLSKQPMCDVKVFDLMFDREHILYADGVEVVSAVV
ncbi:MAG: Hint domain-containing protein [Yoonia sp.]|nr:Hint domain-containing protein [Yoonia sp.]